MSDDFKLHEQMRPASRFALVGLFVLASLYTLYFARALLLPVVLALLLSWSLAPIVQVLKKKLNLPAPLGAALVVGALVAAMGYGAVSLTEPARAWIDKAPDILRQVEIKLRGVRQSVKEVARIAEQAEEIAGQKVGTVENKVSQAPPDLVGRTLSATASFLVSVVSTVILLFLLLAYGGPLTRQIVRMIPAEERRGAIKALRSFHTDIARYLFLLGLLSAGLGAAAGLAMYWLGMPTPVLWAVMVAVFNFVPYLGAVISLVVVTLVAILAIEPLSQALLVPAVVLILTVFEGELLRAIVVGRYFTLNPIVVFLGILLTAWLWGVVGALIAVPLLVSLRIFCINIPALRPFGELISIGAKRKA